MSIHTKWQNIVRTNIRSLDELKNTLLLSKDSLQLIDNSPEFSWNIPRRLVAKMANNDPTDPLFLQFVPLIKEKESAEGFEKEPVRDPDFQKEKKLLHKYNARTLIVTTSSCAMHCRYCFRQNFDYEKGTRNFLQEIRYIASDPSIEEVILSGGDPLSLSDNMLKSILMQLNEIGHVKRIRFHSRFIIGIPERITDTLLRVLQNCSKQLFFVLHVNHVNEFDTDVWNAIRKLQLLGIPILNQAVLLKGVNDSIKALSDLSSELSNHGVLFYYLHQLDKVKGAHHFEVSVQTGKTVIKMLQESTSGYAVPKYVEEIPYKKSKTLL